MCLSHSDHFGVLADSQTTGQQKQHNLLMLGGSEEIVSHCEVKPGGGTTAPLAQEERVVQNATELLVSALFPTK